MTKELGVICRYVSEVSKLTDAVGVAAADKLTGSARGGH
jgi:hypothetical protein